MSKTNIDIKSLELEYSNSKPLLEKFKNELVLQLNTILIENSIKLGFPVQHRIKQFSSIKEKINSNRVHIKKSIFELQDIVGIRLIMLFTRDIAPVENFIQESLVVLKKYNTSEKLNSDQFGYNSIHYVVSIPDEWLKIPSMSRFKDFKAEIQIRTIAQHLWAEASNLMQYKKEKNVPDEIIRSINRVSALLETVDLEFERLLIDRSVYRDKISKDEKEIDDVLNVDSLIEILNRKLPVNNKNDDDDHNELLNNLEILGYNTKQKLNKLIEKHIPKALELDQEIAINFINQYKSGVSIPELEYKDYSPSGGKEEFQHVLNSESFLSHVGLIRLMLDFELKMNMWDKIREIKNSG
jgi:ppGpp synthetase/RelA/SpoT-type nucleotidyltranferase